MPKGSVSITRPNYDDATSYLHKWSEEIIGEANNRGISLIDLSNGRATKKEMESVITKIKPKFIVFNGHGSSDAIAGHNGKTLIKLGKNEHLLKSRIIYAVSCDSGKKLGPGSIVAGATTYVGYEEGFAFLFDRSRTATHI